MRRLGLLAVVLGMLTGCGTVQRPKNENPVLQAPPRRLSFDDSRAVDHPGANSSSEIRQVRLREADADEAKVFNAKVVARVNGAPVFAGEVLERWGPVLKTAHGRLPAEDFIELRDAIVQVNLRGHIERKLLAERMRSSLKPDQIKQLEAHVDRLFEKEIDKLKAQMEVSTRTELELALNERGTTLDAYKEGFVTQRLAIEYVGSHIERPPPLTRPELVAYYQAHLDEYKIPARVLWQHVQVDWNARVGREEAARKIAEAHQALLRGEPFDDVARRLSDGPTASDGGRWDWTNRGSLAEHKLEEVLFVLPVGQISSIIEGRSAFHLVKVLDRQAESRRPFAELQDEIAQKLEAERRNNLPEKFVEQLYQEAIIETSYDLSPDGINAASVRMSQLFQQAGINLSRG
uniref:PpiC domain-containing protein n=1 Tax=Schlesneria paludicola TaxID=360056 RepID=A0A7C4QQW0_9PLAN